MYKSAFLGKERVKGLKMPEISVIMSVYNGETYLEEAINSVCNQTFTDWELIVINDCSSDKTDEILDKYAKADKRIRVYENEVNLKLPSSLNKAAALAEGKYIARMDADDMSAGQTGKAISVYGG